MWVFSLAPLSLPSKQLLLLPQPLVHYQWLLHKPHFYIFLVLDSLVTVVTLPSLFANIVVVVVCCYCCSTTPICSFSGLLSSVHFYEELFALFRTFFVSTSCLSFVSIIFLYSSKFFSLSSSKKLICSFFP